LISPFAHGRCSTASKAADRALQSRLPSPPTLLHFPFGALPHPFGLVVRLSRSAPYRGRVADRRRQTAVFFFSLVVQSASHGIWLSGPVVSSHVSAALTASRTSREASSVLPSGWNPAAPSYSTAAVASAARPSVYDSSPDRQSAGAKWPQLRTPPRRPSLVHPRRSLAVGSISLARGARPR